MTETSGRLVSEVLHDMLSGAGLKPTSVIETINADEVTRNFACLLWPHPILKQLSRQTGSPFLKISLINNRLMISTSANYRGSWARPTYQEDEHGRCTVEFSQSIPEIMAASLIGRRLGYLFPPIPVLRERKIRSVEIESMKPNVVDLDIDWLQF